MHQLRRKQYLQSEPMTIVVTFNQQYDRRFLYRNELFSMHNIADYLENNVNTHGLPEVIGELITIKHSEVVEFMSALNVVHKHVFQSVNQLLIYFENGPGDPMPSIHSITGIVFRFKRLVRLSIWMEPTCGNLVNYWETFCNKMERVRKVTQLDVNFRNAANYEMVDLSGLGLSWYRQLTIGHFNGQIADLIHRLNSKKLLHLALCFEEETFYHLQELLREEPTALREIRSLWIKLKSKKWTITVENGVENFQFDGFEHFFQYMPKLEIFRLEYTSLVAFASPLVRNPLRLIRANNCVTDLTLMGIAICRLTGAASIAVSSVTKLTIVLPETTEFFSFFRCSLNLSQPTDPVRMDHFWAVIFCVFPNLLELLLVGSIYGSDEVQDQLQSSLRSFTEEHGFQNLILRSIFSEFILPDEE